MKMPWFLAISSRMWSYICETTRVVVVVGRKRVGDALRKGGCVQLGEKLVIATHFWVVLGRDDHQADSAAAGVAIDSCPPAAAAALTAARERAQLRCCRGTHAPSGGPGCHRPACKFGPGCAPVAGRESTPAQGREGGVGDDKGRGGGGGLQGRPAGRQLLSRRRPHGTASAARQPSMQPAPAPHTRATHACVMSPWSISAWVRGMGVAVMCSTCGAGLALASSRPRCSTPNLRGGGERAQQGSFDGH